MTPKGKLHVLLPLSTMKDGELQALAINIVKLGPQSPLFANATIANGVNAVAAKAAMFSEICQTVTDTAKLLSDNRATKLGVRAALESEIAAFAGSATNLGTTEAQLTGLALTPRDQAAIPRLGPAVPEGLVLKMPKYQRGYFDISVYETGGTRGRYDAEWSLDPIGTWAVLTGTGKSRRVIGASGTKVWVRFARVRGRVQSDWCTPMLVVIP